MTPSRILTVVGVVGVTLVEVAHEVELINPSWGLRLSLLGLALTTFNERAQGGLSRGPRTLRRRGWLRVKK